MKILFYDIKKNELEFLLENSINNVEAYFFKTPLNQATYVDDKFLVGYGLDYDGYYRNIPYIGYVEGV